MLFGVRDSKCRCNLSAIPASPSLVSALQEQVAQLSLLCGLHRRLHHFVAALLGCLVCALAWLPLLAGRRPPRCRRLRASAMRARAGVFAAPGPQHSGRAARRTCPCSNHHRRRLLGVSLGRIAAFVSTRGQCVRVLLMCSAAAASRLSALLQPRAYDMQSELAGLGRRHADVPLLAAGDWHTHRHARGLWLPMRRGARLCGWLRGALRRRHRRLCAPLRTLQGPGVR